MTEARRTDDPSERLEACFAAVARTRMAGLPFVNASLAVEAVGFRAWEHRWIGVLVTPWSMNLMLLPGRGAWSAPAVGEECFVEFPAGRFRFVSASDAGVGEHLDCSLMSPLLAFTDMEAARLTARSALEALFSAPVDAPAPAVPTPLAGRRAFLMGGGVRDDRG